MAWDKQNFPIVRTAYVAVPDATCDIALGDAGLWNDNGTFKFRSASGADTTVATTAGSFSGSTSDATPLTLATIAIPLNESRLFEIRAKGTKVGGGDAGTYVFRAGYLNVAGSATLIAAQESNDFISETDPTWGGPDTSPSGANVLVQVVGKAGTAISWSVSVTTL